MKKVTSILLMLSIVFIIIGFLVIPNNSIKKDKPTITVTTTFLGDAITQLAGDKVHLNVLMGPGVDPHVYQAKPSDLDKIYNSDILVYGGLNLEGKFGEIIGEMDIPGLKIINSTDNINRDDLIVVSENGEHTEYDPHIWFDVYLWTNVVNYIAEEIKEELKCLEKTIDTNLVLYNDKLKNLDIYIKNKVEELPKEQRILITAHDAFSYFGIYAGFRVEAIQGVSGVTEASTTDISKLGKIIIDNNIKAIFVESSVSPKLIESLQSSVEAKGNKVVIGGSLYSDSAGNIGTIEGTYIGMFEYDINTIIDKLR